MNKRQSIRKTLKLPIRYRVYSRCSNEKIGILEDIGEKGFKLICFDNVVRQTVLEFYVPLKQGGRRVFGQVIWCKEVEGMHVVGLRFFGEKQRLMSQLADGVGIIEDYHVHRLAACRTEAEAEEAARRWVEQREAEQNPVTRQSDASASNGPQAG